MEMNTASRNGSAPSRTHGLRNEMHFSTKDLQITLRCIHLLSGKAAPSHHCHQISAVNNPAASADSCKVVISLRIPWDMEDLGVTIAGEPFPHMVYHLVLTYSN